MVEQYYYHIYTIPIFLTEEKNRDQQYETEDIYPSHSHG